MEEKPLQEIQEKIRRIPFSNFDLVVSIARGGIIPGVLVSRWLDIPMEILKIRYRDDAHTPMYAEPRVEGLVNFPFQGKRILLVDDVSRSGKTFRVAKAAFEGAEIIKTFVINGEADYSCYNGECFRFPWLMK